MTQLDTNYRSTTSINILIIGIISILVLPMLLQHGMFLDGVTYGAIAHLLHYDIGQLSAPFYTSYLGSVFYDQMPLGLGLQALFFDIFGDHYWVERLYCLTALVLTSLVLVRLYRLHVPSDGIALLPTLLFVVTPIVLWSYQQNILEVTVCLGATVSIYAYTRYMQSGMWWFLLIAIAAFIGAIGAKGPTGAYPLAAGAIYLLAYRRWDQWQRTTVQVLASMVILYGLYLVPIVGDYVDHYLQAQLLPALAGNREVTVEHRGELLLDLVSEVAVPLAIGLILWLSTRRHIRTSPDRSTVIYYLLLGLSASIPMLISVKQRRFYLMPSIAMFSMAIAIWLTPHATYALSKCSRAALRSMSTVGYLLLGVALTLCTIKAGTYSRDEYRLPAILRIASTTTPGSTVSADRKLCDDWAAHAYLARHAMISIQCDSISEQYISADYRLVPDPTSH